MKKIYIIDTNILQVVFNIFNQAKNSLPPGTKYGIVWREIKNYILNPQGQQNLLQHLDLSQEGSKWVMDLFVGNQPNIQLVIPSQTYNESIYGLSSKVSTVGATSHTMDIQQQSFAVEKKKILDALDFSPHFNGPNIEIELFNMSHKDSPDKLSVLGSRATEDTPILKLLIPSLENELQEMAGLINERWDKDHWQDILTNLENSSNSGSLSEDQEIYKRRLTDYKAYKQELEVLEEVTKTNPQLRQVIPLSIREWLQTTQDPFFTELIEEGVTWYRDLHTVSRMDEEFEKFKTESVDLVRKFQHIKQYLDPLVSNPSNNINKIINAYDPLTLQSYDVPESLDRNSVAEAREKVIEDLVIRFSHNNEELDTGDFRIARYASKYQSLFSSDDVVLLTFNTKQLGELSAPNFLYNLYGLKIKFPQIEGVAHLGFDGLRFLFSDNLNSIIAQIDTTLQPLSADTKTKALVDSLKTKLLEYYNSTPLPTSFDIFHDIRMLNNLKVENGQIVIDLDKLLQSDVSDVKNTLSRLKDKVFTNINIDNVSTLRTDPFTIQKIQEVIDKISNPRQFFKPLEYLHTLYKYQSLLSVEVSNVKIDLNSGTINLITPEILNDINKKLFPIQASSFSTQGTSPVLMDKIDEVVRHIGARNSAPLIAPLADLRIEIQSLPVNSMPSSCGLPGVRTIRDLSSKNCLDIKKIKQPDEVISHDNTIVKTKLAAKLDKYSNKLDIALMLKQVFEMNPKDIPQAGVMIGAPIAAQIGLQKFIAANPRLGEHLLKNIDQAFKNLPLTIKQNLATDILQQLTKSMGANLLNNSPAMIGPIINTVWSGINIYEAAKKLNSEEGKNSEGILIFTIVSESAIITCSLLQGGALAMGISVPGLNIAITTIVVVQQLAYAINNGIDKVKEVNSQLSLSTAEDIEVFLRSIVGKGLPEYLENNLIASAQYNDLISKAIKNAKEANFDVIAITLPKIKYTQIETLESPCPSSSWQYCGSIFKKCTIQAPQNIHFSNDNPKATLSIQSFSNIDPSLSRIIEKTLQAPQQFICAPNNNDVSVEKTVIQKCDPVHLRRGGIHEGKLSLHTNDDNTQNNICDSSVVIDLDSNTENSNILYSVDGELAVNDPATSTMTSIVIMHPNTNMTRAPMGTNYFIPTDNIWDDERVNLSGNEVYNIVRLTSGKVATNFNPDTKVDLLLAKDCHISINNSPTIKSLGNNIIFLVGDNTQQLVDVGVNDCYYINLKNPNTVRFWIDVNNTSENDNTTIFASTPELETKLILSIRAKFTFLSELQYNKDFSEFVITFTNNQKITIYNYSTFKDCIAQFQDGVFLDLNQFKNIIGKINTIPVINMMPPENWNVNAIIHYLQEIEISPFYERFKFNLLVNSKDNSSFYGHISNIDTQHIVETKPHLTNYFSLGGVNNNLVVKDEVDVYIVQHNAKNVSVRFAADASWEYKPSNIDYTNGDIRVEYMKTQTDSNFQIQQGGELSTINIITGNNANSFLRINFGVGDSYVVNPGQKTLTQDNAIILDAGTRATISTVQLERLNNKISLPEMEVEDVILFFDENDELILIHRELNQYLSIKGNKNEVQFLFKNTSSYEIYPSVDYATFLQPGEYEYDLANNPYIILIDDIPKSLIVKILINEQEASIHNIAAYSPQKDVLVLHIGENRLTIYGWDSYKLLRPVFLLKNNVSLNLNNFDTSYIIEINQSIKVQSKLAVIEHQSQHFSSNIEKFDKIAAQLGNKDNPQCEAIITQTDEISKSDVELLASTHKIPLVKAFIWWFLNKYYTLKISNPDKSQEELVNLVQECTSHFVDEQKLQQILSAIEKVKNLTPTRLRDIVQRYASKGLCAKIKEKLDKILNKPVQNNEQESAENISINENQGEEIEVEDNPIFEFLFMEALQELDLKDPVPYYTSDTASIRSHSIVHSMISGARKLLNALSSGAEVLIEASAHGVKQYFTETDPTPASARNTAEFNAESVGQDSPNANEPMNNHNTCVPTGSTSVSDNTIEAVNDDLASEYTTIETEPYIGEDTTSSPYAVTPNHKSVLVSSPPATTSSTHISSSQNKKKPLEHSFTTTSCVDGNERYTFINEQGDKEVYTKRTCDTTTFVPYNCQASSNGSISCPEIVLATQNCNVIREAVQDGIYAIPTQEDITSYCTSNSPTISRGGEFNNSDALNKHLQGVTATTALSKSSIMNDSTGQAVQHLTSESFMSLGAYVVAMVYSWFGNNRSESATSHLGIVDTLYNKFYLGESEYHSDSEFKKHISKLNKKLKKLGALRDVDKEQILNEDTLQSLKESLDSFKNQNCQVTISRLNTLDEVVSSLYSYLLKEPVTKKEEANWIKLLSAITKSTEENQELCKQEISGLHSELNSKICYLMYMGTVPTEFMPTLKHKQITGEFIDFVKQMSISNTACRDAYNIIITLRCVNKHLFTVNESESIKNRVNTLQDDLNQNSHMTLPEKEAFTQELISISTVLHELYGYEMPLTGEL